MQYLTECMLWVEFRQVLSDVRSLDDATVSWGSHWDNSLLHSGVMCLCAFNGWPQCTGNVCIVQFLIYLFCLHDLLQYLFTVLVLGIVCVKVNEYPCSCCLLHRHRLNYWMLVHVSSGCILPLFLHDLVFISADQFIQENHYWFVSCRNQRRSGYCRLRVKFTRRMATTQWLVVALTDTSSHSMLSPSTST